ncbi:MAG: haloacid dehalogenase type II [Candidatus Koribacter versatilis]|uniref:Haloacid dehalogenase type II n=1 Tax=Candidatus Korobacter versatilis TaxID=658062 RepID=A0A932EQ74_9BACT|nr:haloacid dehalogenase type II [Candidatus Koribacter versatilis]
MTLDFSKFEVLTFDCYGTLIDWETGILGALRPLTAQHGKALSDAELLALYGELEARIEAGPYQRYREVLRGVVRGMGERLGFQATEAEMDSLPGSLGAWPPFPDTVAALRRLKTRYRLAIISNTDDGLFAQTAKRLEVPLDAVVTAEQAGSYKPAFHNFHMALERLGVAKEKVLHVGQSRHHDIAPSRALGIRNVLVVRRGRGAVLENAAQPDVEVPDLKTLADLAGV